MGVTKWVTPFFLGGNKLWYSSMEKKKTLLA